MLRALGHTRIDRFHLNEGHAALAVLELLAEETRRAERGRRSTRARGRAPALRLHHAHAGARGPRPLSERARRSGGRRRTAQRTLAALRPDVGAEPHGPRAAQRALRERRRHATRARCRRGCFPSIPIRSITNGIHPATWAAPAFRALFDLHFREWRRDAQSLRYAVRIPLGEIWWAHSRAKRALLERLKQAGATGFREEAFTIGFARRSTAYKRSTLLFHDLARLRALAQSARPAPARLRRQGAPARRRGQGADPARLRGRRRARRRDLRRLSPGLRHGDGARCSSRAATSGSTLPCRRSRPRARAA